MVTTTPGLALIVWTADCVPVLLTGDGVVAAVHAGWRGCAHDVVQATVTEMERVAGVVPEGLRAALGPAVCGSCYEVGPEVPEALGRFGLDESRWIDRDRVDLRGFLTARLEHLGLRVGAIESVGGCTVESPALASYRRDGHAAGRQWAMVALTGGEQP
jgi:YfiH family protein